MDMDNLSEGVVSMEQSTPPSEDSPIKVIGGATSPRSSGAASPRGGSTPRANSTSAQASRTGASTPRARRHFDPPATGSSMNAGPPVLFGKSPPRSPVAQSSRPSFEAVQAVPTTPEALASEVLIEGAKKASSELEKDVVYNANQANMNRTDTDISRARLDVEIVAQENVTRADSRAQAKKVQDDFKEFKTYYQQAAGLEQINR